MCAMRRISAPDVVAGDQRAEAAGDVPAEVQGVGGKLGRFEPAVADGWRKQEYVFHRQVIIYI